MWILMAFRRTIGALIREREGNKTLVVTQLFVLYIGSIFVIICLKVAAIVVKKDSDAAWEVPVRLEAASYGVYALAMLLLMIILRPTSEATRETFSYVEALPTEPEDQEILPAEANESCFRRRSAGGGDQRSSELASLSDIRNQQSIDEEAKQHSIEKANVE